MTPTQVNRETFLQHLRQSGLVTSREFRKVIDSMPEVTRGRSLARALVDWGMITKFQAELLLIGRTSGFFLGPYKILDQLGQGGMGRVYKALHQTMNRTVALKVLAPHLVKTSKAQKLFLREVQAAAKLNHPNIVTAYDANQVSGRHFLAMEYVDGPNLEQLVREQGQMPVEMACEIIRQAANGLQHAHEHDMIHRDIKPANLLLQPAKNLQSFVVKILDFGLAKLLQPATQDLGRTVETKENTVMGTPDFLSPEQARNLHQVDGRSDLYSLGCTFYYLLTGKVPFPGGTTLEKLLRHASVEPAAVENFRGDVPAPVSAILKKLLAKDTADRFQTPLELSGALAPFAVACAPTWDEQARHAQASLNTSTPPPVSDAPLVPALESGGEIGADSLGGDPRGEKMVDTFPPGLPLTPLANFDEGPILPWTETDPHDRRLARKALLWSVGIVTSLIAFLAGIVLLFGGN